ncbi:MAG: hypothetical protein AAGA20_22355, partial [Planctomycetota bacterium]
AAMAFTGLPTTPMLALAGVCGVMAFFAGRKQTAVAAGADSVPADRDPARGRVEPSGTRASRTGAELRWWSERDAGLVKRWRERAASARDGSRK